MKKADDRLIDYLNQQEIQALLDAPNPATHSGNRDRAMLHLTFAVGLRVSELVGLTLEELQMKPTPTIHIRGKGRRERVLPLWKETVAAIQSWLNVRYKAQSPEIFLNARGKAMTRSGFEYILAKHVITATHKQPSLKTNAFLPMSFAIVVLFTFCKQHTIFEKWPYGWGMRICKAQKPICESILPRNWRPSPVILHPC
jgi:site-specific recombinase XerD